MGPRRLPLAAVTVALAVTSAAPRAGAAPPGDPAPLGGWVRPVDGEVVRPFEEPASHYGPGHRGADLAAAPGTVVRAANDGVVSFAGAVAGALHVVVAHDGGLRTSYSFLARVDVRTGEAVARGQPVGVAGGGGGGHDPGILHFGLRVGERYVDPMILFGPLDLTELVHLVPTDLPPPRPWSRARERAELRRAVEEDHGGDGCASIGTVLGCAVDLGAGAGRAAWDGTRAAAGAAGRAAGGLTRWAASGAQAAARVAVAAWAHTPTAALTRDLREVTRRIVDYVRSRRGCSDGDGDGPGPAGSGHLLVAVAGINSQGGPRDAPTPLDVDALGYHRDEVTYFSYDRGGGTYTKEDTWGDLRAAADRLARQLKDLHAREPGREVDLIAHSQGGIVVDVFLQHVYDAADPAYPPIGTIVTLASPHEGAPLATAARDLRRSRSGEAATDAAAALLPVPPADSAAARQVAEGSRLLEGLWRERLPDHVELTTIGGSDDVLVPADGIGVPGATEVVVSVDGGNDHSEIVTDPGALGVVRAALEGRPPPCVGWADGLRGSIAPVVISRFERTVGDVADGAGILVDGVAP